MLSIHPEQLQLTVLLGSVSGNTQNLMGICHHIAIKPATSTTQYDISIVDSSGIVVYERTGEIGTLSELLELPVRDIYTISLTNVTVDELFIIKLNIRE